MGKGGYGEYKCFVLCEEGFWSLVTMRLRRVGSELPSWSVLSGREPGGILWGTSSAGRPGNGAGNKGASACADSQPISEGIDFFPPKGLLCFSFCKRKKREKRTNTHLNTLCSIFSHWKRFIFILRKNIGNFRQNIFFTCFHFAKNTFCKRGCFCVRCVMCTCVRVSSVSFASRYEGPSAASGVLPPSTKQVELISRRQCCSGMIHVCSTC